MPAKGSFNFASGPDTFLQAHRPKSLLEIAVPAPAASELTSTPYLGPTFVTTGSPTSSSLYQLLGETATEDVLTVSAVRAPGESKSYAIQPTSILSPDTQKRDLDPFLSPTHSDIMFPSLSNVIDTLLDDKSSPKFEVDSMGCVHLPASEFMIALESDCNFHYEFWDGFHEAQFCLPIDLVLLLNPSRAHLYEFYALAAPFVTRIAARLTSVTAPTRFTRLVPKLPPPGPGQDINVSSTQTYFTSYRGSILRPPKGSEEPEVVTPAKGIYLAPNWERIAPGTTTFTGSTPEPSSKDKENKNLEFVKRGFTLRTWMPIPTSLFENKETCTFRVDVRIWIEDPYNRSNENGSGSKTKYRHEMGKNGVKWEIGHFPDADHDHLVPQAVDCDGDERLVEISRIVTVSHLQRRRDMS